MKAINAVKRGKAGIDAWWAVCAFVASGTMGAAHVRSLETTSAAFGVAHKTAHSCFAAVCKAFRNHAKYAAMLDAVDKPMVGVHAIVREVGAADESLLRNCQMQRVMAAQNMAMWILDNTPAKIAQGRVPATLTKAAVTMAFIQVHVMQDTTMTALAKKALRDKLLAKATTAACEVVSQMQHMDGAFQQALLQQATVVAATMHKVEATLARRG
jgi:hypothetical protein